MISGNIEEGTKLRGSGIKCGWHCQVKGLTGMSTFSPETANAHSGDLGRSGCLLWIGRIPVRDSFWGMLIMLERNSGSASGTSGRRVGE
jgi:hypothetical protein